MKGLTTAQIAAGVGKSIPVVRVALRKLIAAGMWQMVGCRDEPRIDGRMFPMALYAPVKR